MFGFEVFERSLGGSLDFRFDRGYEPFIKHIRSSGEDEGCLVRTGDMDTASVDPHSTTFCDDLEPPTIANPSVRGIATIQLALDDERGVVNSILGPLRPGEPRGERDLS